jgi:hypothetical protein
VDCDKKFIIEGRSERQNENFQIFSGVIASGNQVIKDAETRDELRNVSIAFSVLKLKRRGWRTLIVLSSKASATMLILTRARNGNFMQLQRQQPAQRKLCPDCPGVKSI